MTLISLGIVLPDQKVVEHLAFLIAANVRATIIGGMAHLVGWWPRGKVVQVELLKLAHAEV